MAPRSFSSALSSRCPRCGEDAPLVYRDFVPTCSACGAMRAPLTAPAVAMAGKPSQVGGTVARVFGWSVLAGGGFFSAVLFALLVWLFPGSALAWLVTVPVLLITLGFAFLFVKSGKSLSESGERKEEEVRRKALEAIARQRGGVVTAEDVAGMLRMGVPHADAWLTDLAKREADQISLEVDDDNGRITYRFAAYAPDKWRVQMDQAERAQAAHVASAADAAKGRVAEPQVFDAELVDDASGSQASSSARRR